MPNPRLALSAPYPLRATAASSRFSGKAHFRSMLMVKPLISPVRREKRQNEDWRALTYEPAP